MFATYWRAWPGAVISVADGITDEMVEAGIRAVVALGCDPDGCDPECSCREFDDEDKADFQRMVRTALEGALAGRVVVDLPEPDETDAENIGYWGDVYTGDFVSSRPPNGDPIDFLHGVTMGGLIRTGSLKPERAEQVAGWLLAAARHARTANQTVTVVDLSGVAGGDTR
jgi:hypothetical protein